MFDQNFGQVDQIFGQGFDQGLGSENNKYNVQYYPA